jgi:hypothetical protein
MSTLTENPSDIFQRAVILKLSIGRPGNTSRLRPDQYTVDAVAGRTKAEKRLLESPEVAKATKRQEQLRTAIKKLSLPSPLGDGTYLMAIDTIPLAEKLITDAETTVATLLLDVERMYPTRIEEAKAALNGLFNLADYPPVQEFMDAFYVKSQYVAFGAPEALAKVRGNLLDREKGKINAATMETVQNIFTILSMDMKGLVDKLVARVEKADSGDRTKIKGLLDNVTEFLETLPMRNIVDNADLAELGDKAKIILEGVTPDMIRENAGIRRAITMELTTIQTRLDEIVSLKSKRLIEAA